MCLCFCGLVEDKTAFIWLLISMICGGEGKVNEWDEGVAFEDLFSYELRFDVHYDRGT